MLNSYIVDRKIPYEVIKLYKSGLKYYPIHKPIFFLAAKAFANKILG